MWLWAASRFEVVLWFSTDSPWFWQLPLWAARLLQVQVACSHPPVSHETKSLATSPIYPINQMLTLREAEMGPLLHKRGPQPQVHLGPRSGYPTPALSGFVLLSLVTAIIKYFCSALVFLWLFSFFSHWRRKDKPSETESGDPSDSRTSYTWIKSLLWWNSNNWKRFSF